MWITLTTPLSPALAPPPSSLVPTVRPGRRALAARQLWSAAAAMCLVLLPVAVVVAGLWMGIAGLITGVQWALDVDGSVWLGIGRLRALRVRPLGCGSRGDLEGPQDAEVAPLAQEVITPHEGKRAQRVRQRRQLDIRSAATV